MDSDEEQGGHLRMFFCFNCQTPNFQYQGKIVQIIPGNLPYTPRIVLKCRNSKCDQHFSIMGTISSIKQVE